MHAKLFIVVVAALVCVVHAQSRSSKPGQCVPQITQQRCKNDCRRDSECSGNSKCCPTTCGGMTCNAPMTITTTTRRPQYTVPPTNQNAKPGSCPGPLAQFSCTRECQNDGSCRGNQKCCPTTCGGSMCKPPTTATTTTSRPTGGRPGRCPSSAPRSINNNNNNNGRQAPPCRNQCERDRDCRVKTHKCCTNSCGALECVEPNTH